MTERPPEHLARIKREHPLWSIRAVITGIGWTAHRGERQLWAASLTDLETQLRQADHPRGPKPRL
jgi:hypothetical protein